MAVKIFPSPLRYPGGKLKVANYVKSLFMLNGLMDGDYAEPYAGGCSVALSLLFGKYASRIFINDKDPDVYAFWHSVLNETKALIELIDTAEVTIEAWREMRLFFDNREENHTLLQRGFAAFYMNRTNRSGILEGGVIGGQEQDGDWKVNARFNRKELIQRIKKIANHRGRIFLSNMDAQDFLAKVVPTMRKKSLIYLDPPYYKKGQGLYPNAYGPEEHEAVAHDVAKLTIPWLVSYDNTPEIIELYEDYQAIEYNLYHSAANHVATEDSPVESEVEVITDTDDAEETAEIESTNNVLEEPVPRIKIPKPRRKGKEIMFFSPGLKTPEDVTDPSAFNSKLLHQLHFAF